MSQAIESVITDSSVSADVAALDALLGDELVLEGDGGVDLSGFDTEIVETPVSELDTASVVDLGAEIEAPAELLDAALGEVTIQEAKQAVYAEQSAALELLETVGDTPATDEKALEEAAAASAEPPKPAKKGGTRKPKPEGEAAEKKERMTFVTHSKAEILAKRVEGKSEVLNLELTDFALSPEEQAAKHAALMDEIDNKTAKKVAEKALMVFAGKSATQTVLKIAFETLARDGYLTSGNEGNLHKALLAKPFSQGTAASQGNQIFCLFPLLKIAHKSKGRLDPNPNSTILAKTLTELGLTLKTAE